MNDFPQTSIEDVSVSRLLCGTNSFFGFSHFSAARDKWLCRYFTVERIADVLTCCLEQGVNGVVSSPQPKLHESMQIARERTGRTMIWFCTPGPDGGDARVPLEDEIAWCARHDVRFCMPHTCWTDPRVNRLHERIEDWPETAACIRRYGMIPGFSTHLLETITIGDKRGYDAQVYIQPFNSIGFLCPVETDWVARVINATPKAVIAIKPLAAGRIIPPTGLSFSFSSIKPVDMVCLGLMSPEEAAESIAIARGLLTGRNEPVDLAVTRSKAHLLSRNQDRDRGETPA
jgi:hypothetical protein